MIGERELVNSIRSVMAPANPIPVNIHQGDTGCLADIADRVTVLRSANPAAFDEPERRPVKQDPGGRGSRGNTAWRLVAPALSGLAVVAVVVSLTLAAGPGPAARPSGAKLTAVIPLPRYYVTANAKGVQSPTTLFVHSSVTGQTLGSVRLPNAIAGFFGGVVATKSDRQFYIVADRTTTVGNLVAALYRLRLAKNGRVQSFSTISTDLGLGVNNNVGGIALSPDGTKLAVAVQVFVGGNFPDAEIVVISLNHAQRRVWITRQERAYISDPIWTSDKGIAFLWLDQLRGPGSNFIGRSQERLLNTTAAGSNLLSSQVLATSEPTGKLGGINFALDVSHGDPIIAATARNVPTLGLHGQATARLVALSAATGKVTKVFDTRVMGYHNEATLVHIDYFFAVFGVDASGSHVLVRAPGFGVLTNGKFKALPGGPAHTSVFAAGW